MPCLPPWPSALVDIWLIYDMAKFKARARTVDLLGRQQIAGYATAISELFKNAHDAYARRVEVDYYRLDNLFLLRDNGIGMTLEEFQDKWLTIGTESKVGGGLFPYRPPGTEERPMMGEKGIGRLAIARIGPQVLVMTRARRENVLHDLVVSLVNWELFELPGINLDDIEIPVETCANGCLPGVEDIQRLKQELQKVVHTLAGRVAPQKLADIAAHIEQFRADPQRIHTFFNSGPAIQPNEESLNLSGDGFGTHFLIQPADTLIGEDIDRDQHSDTDPIFTKFLVGFSNTMTPDAPAPYVTTRFRDWQHSEAPSELISGGAFLTEEDFRNADHHFSGLFDEFGQFEGKVQIYDQPPIKHVIPWEGGQGKLTLCGPFRVNIAHLQGNARESRVPYEEHGALTRKLNRFGGLYVYRDGIRILPYGNSDQDWLNIETRRNKGQAYYFFAYRRIFGAVEITQQNNRALVEKAGREGFQTNKAYRQFTAILENFFVQLAADFFRETGTKTDIWASRKEELTRAELARRRKEESAGARRKIFSGNLEAFFAKIEANTPRTEVIGIFEDLQRDISTARSEKDIGQAATRLIDAEAKAEQSLAELRKQYVVTKPRDIGLNSQAKQDWESYVLIRNQLENDVFIPAAEKLRNTIGQAAEDARIQIDQRKRLQKLIDELSKDVQKAISNQAAEVRESAEKRQLEVQELASRALSEVKDTIDLVRAELQRIDIAGLTHSAVELIRTRLENKIDDAANRHREVLENTRQQLLDLRLTSESDGAPPISGGEITGALEDEVLAMREAADADAELVQLGMALAVVTHEFDAVIRTIRNELQRLKGWADTSPQLQPIYNRIHGNFEHLDGYLALFTPLQRRLYRKPQRGLQKFGQCGKW
jgi:gas vesicle protein